MIQYSDIPVDGRYRECDKCVMGSVMRSMCDKVS